MSDRIYYLNPRIKRANLVEEYTAEQILEYKKCAEDPLYFIEKYVKIRSVDKGLIQMVPTGYQIDLVKHYTQHRDTILLAARQSYKTTTSVAYILWYSIFTPDRTVALLANKMKVARELLSRYMLSYENLPFFLQPGCKAMNKSEIELGNGSTVFTAATTSDGIRSRSCVTLDSIVTIKVNDEIKRVSILELMEIQKQNHLNTK